ncbi:flagellar motor switch protein FliN [Rhodobacterales bacterium]|nr:flagellar motor switch protein FliN [Rhodobacterales bacterium]
MSDTFIDHVSSDDAPKTKPADATNFAKVESPPKDHDSSTMGDEKNLDTILGIPVNIQVVLGSATMLVSNLLKLGRGAVIPLNHRVGEPIDIVVNGRVIARGEVVVVEDDNSRFGVSLTEIMSSQAGALEV